MGRGGFLERLFIKKVYRGTVEKNGEVYKKYKIEPRFRTSKKNLATYLLILFFITLLLVAFFIAIQMFSSSPQGNVPETAPSGTDDSSSSSPAQ